MTTFTRAHSLRHYLQWAGYTSCDTCHELVGQGWRDLAAHVAAHRKAAMDAARQARIDALNQLTTTERKAS